MPVIRTLIEQKPVFGICLGHQMLGLALGAKTMKMHQGHHGANHPVKDLATGKVEITSMNHGFAVDRATLPANAEETHVSLFDGSNCGLALNGPAGVFGPIPSRGLARARATAMACSSGLSRRCASFKATLSREPNEPRLG